MRIILYDQDETGLIPITFENINNPIFEGYFVREQMTLEECNPNPIQPDIIFPPTPQEPDDFEFEPEEEDEEED